MGVWMYSISIITNFLVVFSLSFTTPKKIDKMTRNAPRFILSRQGLFFLVYWGTIFAMSRLFRLGTNTA